LYYFALPIVRAFGLTTFAIRFVPALFGIMTVLLVLALQKRIGAIGTLSAAAVLGASPGAVYFSRYFIHETLLVFFTLATVAALARYVEKHEWWTLVFASASIGFLFATKETAIITVGVLTVAAIGTFIWFRWNGGLRVTVVFGTGGSLVFAAIALPLLIVIVLFYSSFLTNWRGLADALRSLAVWSRTGTRAHVHPWATYLSWLWIEESPILAGGCVGMWMALSYRDNAFAVFATIWALGMLTVYSIIPYKTPWLTLNLIVPFALVAGYALNLLWTRADRRFAAVVTILLTAIALYQTISLTFVHYDDEAYPYVYVHTKREVIDLVKQIDGISNGSDGHSPISIAVTSPEHFPLSWYLRYYRTGFYGRVVKVADPVVIGSEYQAQALQYVLGNEYQRKGTYVLRPGIRLVLFVRRGLIQP